MSRNLIICCDGTGNEIKENQSNVLKFYRVIKKEKTKVEQIAFYDTGVGTICNSDPWSRFKYKAAGIFGLVTGYGLDANVLDAYRFLIQNYQEDDHIYLFGFSRGAYTVRVLAGFINMVGILKVENLNLCKYAFTAYKQASKKENFAIAWRVQEVLDAQYPTIRFMGCWDTVSSVIIPRPDRAYLPSLENLPYTKENSCVQTFRHAIAIDEKRRMFRLYPWKEGQKFKTNRFAPEEKAADQDSKQVWFSGVHSDIGGGYAEPKSGAAKIPLAWMVKEAEANGLEFRKEMVKRLVYGINPPNGRDYVAPSENAELHDSLVGFWNILEWIPKYEKLKEWKERKPFLKFYLPRKEPRPIGIEAMIDESVYMRSTYSSGKPYKPINLRQR